MAVSFCKNKAVYIIYGKYDGKARVDSDWKFEDEYITINKGKQDWHEEDGNRKEGHVLKHEWHWLRTDGFVVLRMDVQAGLWHVEDMRYNMVTKRMMR